MIIVNKQFIFKFSVGTFKDFLSLEDLIQFKTHEEAGGVLPTFDLTFNVNNPELSKQLNEGNTIKVSYGLDIENMVDTELFVTKQFNINEGGYSNKTIRIVGVLDRFEFSNNPFMTISDKKSGVEVINDVAGKYFKVDSNITASNDSQNWIQNNITDRAFLKILSLHSFLTDSFIGTAIGLDGKFILRDMKKKLSDNFDWRFTQTPDVNKNNDITFDSDFLPVSDNGFINSWLGYGRKKNINTIEDGTTNEILESFKPLMALTSTLSRKATMEAKFAESGILNDNVHTNYHRAYLKNISNLAIFSSARITLTFQNLFKPIQLLDVAMFKTTESGGDEQGSLSSEVYAGLYFVSKITRNVQDGTILTTVELCRESFNANVGNLK